MKEYRVTIMKITIDYFEVDLKSDHHLQAENKAIEAVMYDPAKHALPKQVITYTPEQTRLL